MAACSELGFHVKTLGSEVCSFCGSRLYPSSEPAIEKHSAKAGEIWENETDGTLFFVKETYAHFFCGVALNGFQKGIELTFSLAALEKFVLDTRS